MYKVEVEEGGAAPCTAVSGSIRDIEVVDDTFFFIEVLAVGGKKKWQ